MTSDLKGIPLSAEDSGRPIVCTLGGGLDAIQTRVTEWKDVIDRSTGHRPIEGGVVLTYDHDEAVAADLGRLAAAEYACCSFFEFILTVGPEGMAFAVTAPPEASSIVTAMFGDGS
jgi:hypothetical protein